MNLQFRIINDTIIALYEIIKRGRKMLIALARYNRSRKIILC